VYARVRVGKVGRVLEHVAVEDVLALRALPEHALLAQREALQRPPELAVLCEPVSARTNRGGKERGSAPIRVAALMSPNGSASASLKRRRIAAWYRLTLISFTFRSWKRVRSVAVPSEC
jgi:hypothetical protein